MASSTNNAKQEIMNLPINKSVFKPSFWDNIPFKRDNLGKNVIIHPDFELRENFSIDKSPILPKGFSWTEIDIRNENDNKLVCKFLNKYYKVHHNRIYKSKFLKWVLCPPKKHFERIADIDYKIWNIGVKTTNTDLLVGYISARPISYKIDDQIINSFRVDYLCVHPEIRGKKLGLILIKEIYRRISLYQYQNGILFNTFKHLPFISIVNTTRMIFRPLNIDKLSKTLFSKVSVDNIYKLKALYENIQPTNDLGLIRSANADDIPKMMDIYYNYASKKRIYQIYNRKEFEYYFLPKNELIYTYVITNNAGQVKDFASFHVFFTKSGEKNSFLYYISFINERLLELFMRNILYIMKSNGIDMLYANSIMGIDNILRDKLHFKHLETMTNYYIFNYNTPNIDPKNCMVNIFV